MLLRCGSLWFPPIALDNVSFASFVLPLSTLGLVTWLFGSGLVVGDLDSWAFPPAAVLRTGSVRSGSLPPFPSESLGFPSIPLDSDSFAAILFPPCTLGLDTWLLDSDVGVAEGLEAWAFPLAAALKSGSIGLVLLLPFPSSLSCGSLDCPSMGPDLFSFDMLLFLPSATDLVIWLSFSGFAVVGCLKAWGSAGLRFLEMPCFSRPSPSGRWAVPSTRPDTSFPELPAPGLARFVDGGLLMAELSL